MQIGISAQKLRHSAARRDSALSTFLPSLSRGRVSGNLDPERLTVADQAQVRMLFEHLFQKQQPGTVHNAVIEPDFPGLI